MTRRLRMWAEDSGDPPPRVTWKAYMNYLRPFRTAMAILVATGLVIAGIDVSAQAAAAAPTSLNQQFRGMNWADPADNFLTRPVVPGGLSTDQTPAETYQVSLRVLGSFETNFKANTVRLAINPETVSSTWWQNYRQIIRAATKLHMKVILGDWGTPGDTQFKIPDMAAYDAMWD